MRYWIRSVGLFDLHSLLITKRVRIGPSSVPFVILIVSSSDHPLLLLDSSSSLSTTRRLLLSSLTQERGEAERRQTRSHEPHEPDAARAQRSALACRRSTAALTAATERHRSTPATRFLGLRRHQVLPASGLVPVQRGVPRSTGHNAGRAYPPEPPGSGVQIPPASTAPAPPLGLPPRGVP